MRAGRLAGVRREGRTGTRGEGRAGMRPGWDEACQQARAGVRQDARGDVSTTAWTTVSAPHKWGIPWMVEGVRAGSV